ncbi:hypothetical protein SKAU_G00352630 [Synaphobranchus kaupii]|uniref:Uncharacterized protein n=1 Tax=Synaphobranchus kaupii TaxID=118154 RepID=A0A9Q1EKZ5_SYNKA|nr:hypothetical protein SKAU_G00352630 [Synaphobranchus kaupii]
MGLPQDVKRWTYYLLMTLGQFKRLRSFDTKLLHSTERKINSEHLDPYHPIVSGMHSSKSGCFCQKA